MLYAVCDFGINSEIIAAYKAPKKGTMVRQRTNNTGKTFDCFVVTFFLWSRHHKNTCSQTYDHRYQKKNCEHDKVSLLHPPKSPINPYFWGPITNSLMKSHHSNHNTVHPVLSTCPLHTDSGWGKERRILIGPW